MEQEAPDSTLQAALEAVALEAAATPASTRRKEIFGRVQAAACTAAEPVPTKYRNQMASNYHESTATPAETSASSFLQ